MKSLCPTPLMTALTLLTVFGMARSLTAGQPRRPAVAPLPREVFEYTGRDWLVFASGKDVEIGGGSNYLANQKLKIYIVPARTIFGYFVPSGTLLAKKYYRATLTADGEGNLPRAKLGKCKPGLYYIIVDYSEDGEFTAVLDGYGILYVAEGK